MQKLNLVKQYDNFVNEQLTDKRFSVQFWEWTNKDGNNQIHHSHDKDESVEIIADLK